LADVGLVQEGSTRILCDNQGAIALAKNPTHHSRTKHIDVQHHFIRERVEAEVIELKYVPTQSMVADVLTKALGKPQHHTLIEKMGLRAFAHHQSGSVEVDVHSSVDSVHSALGVGLVS
jgi:hypothetical protein